MDQTFNLIKVPGCCYTSMLRCYSIKLLCFLPSTAGGNGYINDYPTGRFLRDAKLYEIGAGTSEIRRLILGRAFNKMFKDWLCICFTNCIQLCCQQVINIIPIRTNALKEFCSSLGIMMAFRIPVVWYVVTYIHKIRVFRVILSKHLNFHLMKLFFSLLFVIGILRQHPGVRKSASHILFSIYGAGESPQCLIPHFHSW